MNGGPSPVALDGRTLGGTDFHQNFREVAQNAYRYPLKHRKGCLVQIRGSGRSPWHAGKTSEYRWSDCNQLSTKHCTYIYGSRACKGADSIDAATPESTTKCLAGQAASLWRGGHLVLMDWSSAVRGIGEGCRTQTDLF
eukprot:1114796-Pelagomonas_calceolata.AAC.1